MIRHLVALRFSEGTNEAERTMLFADLSGLKERIDGVLDYQVRKNVSPEEAVVHGFHDMFWFDFRDETVRDTYLDDPTHQVIGARLVAACAGGVEGIIVLDFEV